MYLVITHDLMDENICSTKTVAYSFVETLKDSYIQENLNADVTIKILAQVKLRRTKKWVSKRMVFKVLSS